MSFKTALLTSGAPASSPVRGFRVALPADGNTDSDLTVTAYQIAAEKYGAGDLSAAHAEALMYIAGRMTHLATGHAHRQFDTDTVRLAYGLSCGGGKTLSAKAWIAAVHHLGKPYSVVYAANEIEALCAIKRELVSDFGVPADRIGLLHTLGKHASEPATPREELADKQFLLCSHNMVRTGRKNLDLFNVYRGKPRDLCIIDESLIVSDTWSVKNKWIRAGLDYLDREIEFDRRSELHAVRSYVADTLDRFLAEADEQRDSGRRPALVCVPELSDYAADLQPDAAKLLLPKDCPGSVATLLDVPGREVRVVTEGSRGVAWFVPKVPEELRSVFVLDASHLIRDLSRLKGTNIVEDRRARDPGITYPDMEIEWFKTPAGYGSIVAECRRPVRQRKLLRKVADWIKTRPEGERVNVWTFKQRSKEDPDITAVLAEGLRRLGVDPARITILTHGKAKGSNDYADAPHTAFYGVFEQDKLNFAGQMLGQSKDLLADLEHIERVHKSEVLHDAFQEIARSGVRKIVNGRGGRGSVLFPCWHTDVAVQLNGSKVFRGARLVHREDLEDLPRGPAEPAKCAIVADSIVATLADLPADVERISFMKLKPAVAKRIGFEVTPRVWRDAVAEITVLPPIENPEGRRTTFDWRRDGASFARLAAKDYGFEPAA